MVIREIKKNFEENKMTYLQVGVLMGAGFVLGRKYQRFIDVNNLSKSLRAGKALIPNMPMTEKIFPMAMSIADIKTAASSINHTTVKDAVVVTIEGLPLLFVR